MTYDLGYDVNLTPIFRSSTFPGPSEIVDLWVNSNSMLQVKLVLRQSLRGVL